MRSNALPLTQSFASPCVARKANASKVWENMSKIEGYARKVEPFSERLDKNDKKKVD
jgi:hypothetical protein